MGMKKWWSNRKRESGHGWVSEGLAADSGRREAPVLVSISPTWLLFPSPPLRIRRHFQAKRKISIDLGGLESLALPQGWKAHWENVGDSPDPKSGCQGGKLERQVGYLVFLSHRIECELGSTALLGVLLPWAWGSWRKTWRKGRMSMPTLSLDLAWVWIWLGLALDTESVWSVKVGAVIGQFRVLGEFKINALIKGGVWFRQLTTKLAQSLFCTREILIDLPGLGSNPPLLSPCLFCWSAQPYILINTAHH